MKYAVVHSNDPWLLARLATDLQMSGIKKRYNELCDDDFQHPFNNNNMQWCDVDSFDFNFQNHPCINPTIRHELTPSNYISVLTQILNP